MLTPTVQKVAVIGAGVMGSQIAAQLTVAGLPVLLLDRVPETGEDRNLIARAALDRLKQAQPSPFQHPRQIQLITIGNTEDDLLKLRDVDWIIEAIVEEAPAKSALYRLIDGVRKKGSIVSSNTSSLPHQTLVDGQSEAFARDFLITHFFNPPRMARLLEVAGGAHTRSDALDFICDFADRRLGKAVVRVRDTPGFVANRLGFFFVQTAVNAALDLGLNPVEADAVCSEAMGMPKTGVFGLIDLIGVDLYQTALQSMAQQLPAQDALRQMSHAPSLYQALITRGCLGRKAGRGFYRKTPVDPWKVDAPRLEMLDLQSQAYVPCVRAKAPTLDIARHNLRALCTANDAYGQMAWRVLSQTLVYAANLAGSLADTVAEIDTAMRNGFNWRYGPFEWLDRVGVDWFMARLREEGRPLPAFLLKAAGRTFYTSISGVPHVLMQDGSYKRQTRPVGVLLLEDVKKATDPLLQNEAASLWDLGDSVLCLELHSKMNVINSATLDMLRDTLTIFQEYPQEWSGLVVASARAPFSAGVDLTELYAALTDGPETLEAFIRKGSETFRALRFASFPTVVAAEGWTVGGGCEWALQAAGVQAHAEARIGLVETQMGLVPGWGGCLHMLGRAIAMKRQFGGDIPPVNHVFEHVLRAQVPETAALAIDAYYLRPSDGITQNRDRLLHDAKQRVLDLAKGYQPPGPWALTYAGSAGRAALELALEGYRLAYKLTPHDCTVARSLAAVLCGGDGDPVGPISEEVFEAVQLREFTKLLNTEETRDRIRRFLGIVDVVQKSA